MKRTLASNSAYGHGGIGRHFAQLVEEARVTNTLDHYYCPTPKENDPSGISLPIPSWHGWMTQYTPVRYDPGWKSHVVNDLYDRHVASALDAPIDTFTGFVGKSLHSFRRVEQLGANRLELIAANSHVTALRNRHDLARKLTGISDSWLNGAQQHKTLREYDTADVIYVHSEYTRQSFVEAGLPAAKLRRTYLTVDPRFCPPANRLDDGIFRIVYVGRVDATKGIPLLLDVFDRLHMRAELTIVGSWGTRQMRRYITNRIREDARIHVAPGDPLPALHAANVFVHPTFEDGFGYAPMESLACGTPVIATADTGMKEYITPGKNGFIVPTGNEDALLERIEQVYRTPLARTQSLLPPTYYTEQELPTRAVHSHNGLPA